MPDMTFVNPYNFVPFPQGVNRRKAWGHVGPGHVGDGEWFSDGGNELLYSGSIDMEWELKTPMQLPSNAPEEWVDGNTIRIPGSSLKGVVRSVHEAMFNGCARIFDTNFVPGYRMPARPWPLDQEPDWRLAQVVAAADGKPTRLRLTEDLTFVSATALKKLIPWLPTTGDVVSLDLEAATEREFPESFSRYELSPVSVGPRSRRADVEAAISRATPTPAMVDPDACVFIVTDTRVRGAHPARWASGRLTSDYHDISDRDESAWKNLIRSVAGSDDLRRVLGGIHPQWRQAAQHVLVNQAGQILGRRTLQTGRLFVGDVIWIRLVADDHDRHVEEIRLSQIWRRPGGSLTSGERAPQMEACRPDAEGGGLCLSCATFGSIAADRKRQSDGESVAYRGHVRFSSATAENVTTMPLTRAPLSSPKPGAGGFRLDGLVAGEPREQGDVAAQWGSGADHGARLRGRAFYWHSDPDDQHTFWSGHGARQSQARYRAAQGQPLSVQGVRLVSPEGPTVFRGTVTFDRLPMPALQALLEALVPQRLAGAFEVHHGRRMGVHLGGAKPLGLGTAIPRVARLSVSTTTARYSGGPADEVPELGLNAIRRLVNAVGRPPIDELLTMLDLDGLTDDERRRVSYPPGCVMDRFRHQQVRQKL